ERRPRLAAVGGAGRGGAGVPGPAIIATDDQAVILVAEGDRKDAGGLGAGRDRRFAHLPGLAPVPGTKDPRRPGPPRREPDVLRAAGDEAAAAGREGPLAGQGRRQGLGRERLPAGAAVRGDDQLKLPLDRVAEGDAVLLVPEGDGVEEGRGV